MNIQLDSDIIRGIYLLILMLMAGYGGETFSKETIVVLKTNYMAKHIIVICLIYFTIDYSKNQIDHPMRTLIISFIIWLFYIIISRQSFRFVLLNFILITILYILYDYLEYYKDRYKKNSNKELLDKKQDMDKYIKYTSYLLVVISIIGFIQYYLHKKRQYKGKFKHIKFIFGDNI